MTEHEMNMPKKTGRGVKVALAVSLALNLAVAGLVAGAFLRHGGLGERGHSAPALHTFGTPYMRALTPDDRRAVLSALRSAGGPDLPDREARREMFQEVLEHLRAVPFDAAALKRSVARQASAAVSTQQAAQAAWLSVVSGMTDAERAAYAEAVEEALRRRQERR
jgi:uncharacterized membrane protein